MHIHNCRCFQEHLRMLLQCLRALCKAPGGPGSIWKYLEALVRATGVFGRCACCFQTVLHFADELISPWSNLPQRWASPTTAHSTSGRKNGWLGFWRKSIGALSGSRNVWTHFGMDLCTGRQWWKTFWRHLWTACHWKILIMLNGFGGSELGWFWRKGYTIFGSRGKWNRVAKSNRWLIWESSYTKTWEVTTQSSQIQSSWLWFAGCWMAMISLYPPNNSKPRTPIWGTGRSLWISFTKSEAWKNHTF